MKSILRYIFLFLFTLPFGESWRGVVHAQQNLVLNPSFEDTLYCPINVEEICASQHWFQPNFYSGNVCNSGSTDLVFYNCNEILIQSFAGYQNPNNGAAYIHIYLYGQDPPPPFNYGMHINFREYVEGTLKEPLKKKSIV